jgi:hypothetical protein
MSFRDYKEHEQELKDRFPGITLRVEPIEPADHYYTDGDSEKSICKVIFTGGNTVYLPQLIYNVDPQHKKIIEGWILYVKSKG